MHALLVTGASGLLGRELISRMSRTMRSTRIFVLTREAGRIPESLRGSRFHVLTGDITRRDLGLASWQTASLRRTLSGIVHCAAANGLEQTLEEARRVNVSGTGQVLQFASECPRLTKFLHLSTVYVAGRCPDRIPESVLTHSARFSSAWQQSKYEAESLVASYASVVPAVIARISNLIGDSQSGAIARTNCVHEMIRLFPQSGLPVIPLERRALADMVAVDWVADAIAWLFDRKFVAGAVWHLSDGPTAGYTLRDVLADTHRVFAHHPAGQKWLPIELPRQVSLAEYEEFVERTLSTGSRMMRTLVRSVAPFIGHLGIAQTFENHHTRTLLEGSGIDVPPVRATYAGVVRWCLDTEWGRACAV